MLYVFVVLLQGVLNAENLNSTKKLSVKVSYEEAGSHHGKVFAGNCEVSCEIWEEIFEDIDKALINLKATDDIMKSDITRKVFQSKDPQIKSITFKRLKRLNTENVDQNYRIESIEHATEDLRQDYNKTESHLIVVDDALQELEYQDEMIKLNVSRNV